MNAPAFTPGGKIDAAKPFKPVKVAVLTISDTRDEESDTSGDLLAGRVSGAGHAERLTNRRVRNRTLFLNLRSVTSEGCLDGRGKGSLSG